MLEGMGQWTEEVFRSLGYVGIALMMLIENLFPPIPSEIVLPLAGFLVGRGEIGFVPALVAATIGSVVGALMLYALGRWGGLPLVLRYGKILRITRADVERSEEWFARYGDWVVFFTRMVPLARSVVSVPAGMMRMPLLRFTLLTTAGTTIWNVILIGAGWALGSNWQVVERTAGAYSNVILVITLVASVALVVWWWNRRYRGRNKSRSR